MRFTQSLWKNVEDLVGEMTIKYSNLPKSYIRRSMRQIEWQTPRGNPRYLPKTIERRKFNFTLNRPWTTEFYMDNYPHTSKRKVFVEPIETWSYFRGDRVELLVGRDKGKQGIISQIIQERNWVIVEGLNWEYKILGKTKNYPGAYIRSEKPLLVTTDIQLVDPSDLQSTAFEWRYAEDGSKVRVSIRSGRIIPIPVSDIETYDYKTPASYLERDKDTKAPDVENITFYPKLKTFEMEIMDEMGIKEDRVPARTFWY